MRALLALVCALIVYTCSTPAAVRASVINGDFETGATNPWTLFVTSGGLIAASGVDTFDTGNTGLASLAAHFQVGRSSISAPAVPEGGGIFQMVNLPAGEVSVGAKIAVHDPDAAFNIFGGLVELFLDGILIDSHDFGMVDGGTSQFATLGGTQNVSEGEHEVRFRITRPAGVTPGTPVLYIDDVVVPEPATAALGCAAAVVAIAALRFRRARR